MIKPLVALVVAMVALAASASTASGAATLGLELTHSPDTMPSSDRQIVYTAEISNTAQAAATAAVGQLLRCDGEPSPVGSTTWFPLPSTGVINSYAYEWRRNGAAIPSETSTTYTVTGADAGAAIQCLVTATNALPADPGTLRSVAAVSLPALVGAPAPVPAPPAPASATVAASRPTIAGAGTAMRTCTAPANWTAGTTYTFQWLRNATPIAGATASTYAPSTGVGGLDTDKLLQCMTTGTNGGGSVVGVSASSAVGTIPQPPNNVPSNTPSILNPNATDGPVTFELELAPGMRVQSAAGIGTANSWTCSSTEPSELLPAVATCTRPNTVAPQQALPPVEIKAGIVGPAPNPAVVTGTASGGGAPATSVEDEFHFGPPVAFGIASFFAGAQDILGNDYTQAGGHPLVGRVDLDFDTAYVRHDAANETDRYGAIESLRSVVTDLPGGFVGNPEAIAEQCDSVGSVILDSLDNPTCPPKSIVGFVRLITDIGVFKLAVYAVEPSRGVPAQFMFVHTAQGAAYTLVPRLRANDGYALSVDAPNAPKKPLFMGADVTLCGAGTILGPRTAESGLGIDVLGCRELGDPEANDVPLLTNPAACSGAPLVTRVAVDSWTTRGSLLADGSPDLSDPDWKQATAASPPTTGCDEVPFSPAMSISPTSSDADSASGLDAEITVPVDGLLDPQGISQAHLKKVEVSLPEGVSVNPSGATGLAGCTDAQLKLGTNEPVACPEGSKIGAVEVETPLIEEHLTGDMILRTPKSTDPASGEMLRLVVVARSEERGLLVKLPGSATADPQTGRLEATFDNNPQVPFSKLTVKLKGGPRGMLAMPQTCGQIETETALTSWNDLNDPVVSDTPTDVGGDCELGFAPKLAAGMDDDAARGSGAFSFRFSREDGEQWVDGLTADLPPGLLASVRDVPLCSSADAEAGSCPVGSRIGTVDAAAGAGDPFVLERKGDAYLTEGYKGCAYGLAVKVPVVAGPFDGSSPETDLGDIVVRQSVCVDRTTAQVTATSDPLPTIWHGIPLRVRSVTVKVDRPGFMLNPSGCAPKQVGGSFHSTRDATANASVPFQASGCAALPFKPKLALRLIGKRQVTTGTHPRVKAVVTQDGVGEAGIEKTVVRLPKSLALDPNNAQALCEFADGTKPDLENHCPKGSIVGRARAKTPLLKEDLVGNVYFVKNIRIDPKTGNEIRTLPMIVVALRGEIAVNLKGESSTTKGGKLVNTFANVPDAPIRRFNLNIRGGKNGILAVTRTRRAKINLCAGRHIAEVDNDGQNGRRHDFDVRMKTPCTKKQTKNAKRAAKKAARNARNARR